jgi:hypothetical protein
VLFNLFFAKEYPTNKTLNTANKILMKKKNKSNVSEKKLCNEKLPKFEQHFELVSRIVTLNLLTRCCGFTADGPQRGGEATPTQGLDATYPNLINSRNSKNSSILVSDSCFASCLDSSLVFYFSCRDSCRDHCLTFSLTIV